MLNYYRKEWLSAQKAKLNINRGIIELLSNLIASAFVVYYGIMNGITPLVILCTYVGAFMFSWTCLRLQYWAKVKKRISKGYLDCVGSLCHEVSDIRGRGSLTTALVIMIIYSSSIMGFINMLFFCNSDKNLSMGSLILYIICTIIVATALSCFSGLMTTADEFDMTFETKVLENTLKKHKVIIPGLGIIVCANKRKYIGNNGKLLYRLKGDMEHFKRVTTKNSNGNNILICGRKTFESIPSILERRLTIVITSMSDEKLLELCKTKKNSKLEKNLRAQVTSDSVELALIGVWKAASLEEALAIALLVSDKFCCDYHDILQQGTHIQNTPRNIWIIGGERVYREGIKYASVVDMTLVDDDSEGDVMFDVDLRGMRRKLLHAHTISEENTKELEPDYNYTIRRFERSEF